MRSVAALAVLASLALLLASACGGGGGGTSIPTNLSPSETVRTFLQLKIEGEDEEAAAQMGSSQCDGDALARELFSGDLGGEELIDLDASEFEQEVEATEATVRGELPILPGEGGEPRGRGALLALVEFHLLKENEQWKVCDSSGKLRLAE
jgi:hypothetical protein